MDLDDEARERLGSRVIVTRDGSHLFLYANTQASCEEAERVVRELIAEDELTGVGPLDPLAPGRGGVEGHLRAAARDAGGASRPRSTRARSAMETRTTASRRPAS